MFDLIGIIKQYGIFWGVCIAAILILFYGIGRSDLFADFFSKIRHKFGHFISHIFHKKENKKIKNIISDKVISDSDIINHDIFNYIDFLINSKIPTMTFSSEYRKTIFRKYLTIYLKSYKDGLYDFVITKKYQKMDKSTLWNNFLQLLNDTVYDYEKEMFESGVPKIIIDKIKTKNHDVMTLTIDITSGICNNNFYDSDKNLLKTYSILNIMLSILENSISNIEEVFTNINGELKNFEDKKNL